VINRVAVVIVAGIALATLSACTGRSSVPKAATAVKPTPANTATAANSADSIPPVTQPWKDTPLPPAVVQPVLLSAISATDPSDVLAAGAESTVQIFTTAVNGLYMGQLLILGWTGKAWSAQPVDVSFHGRVTAVAAGAHGTGWAIAEDMAGQYHLLRLSAGVWRDTAYPDSNAAGLVLTDVAVAPDGTAWAVGVPVPAGDLAGYQLPVKSVVPLILHWAGGAWHQVAAPIHGWWPVQAVATADGVWLAGEVQPSSSPDPSYVRVAVAHLTADGWRTATEPPLSGYLFEGVGVLAVAADGSAWIQADVSYAALAEGAPGGELLHWSSGHWTASLPWYGYNSLVLEKDTLVMVSDQPKPAGAKLPPVVPAPNSVTGNQVVVVPGTTQLWADAGNWIAYYP
jgi:hypothetical protein